MASLEFGKFLSFLQLYSSKTNIPCQYPEGSEKIMRMDEFRKWLVLGGLEPRTVKTYETCLTVLLREVKEWNHQNITDWLVGKIGEDYKKSTLNWYVLTIRKYSQFLGIADQRLLSLHYFVPENTSRTTLSDEEMEKLYTLERPPRSDKSSWAQTSLLFKLLACTGARPHEIADLTPEDIDLANNAIHIRKTKTGTPRVIMLPPNCKEDMKTFEGFTTQRGKKLSSDAWSKNFKKRLEILGIKRKGLSVYSLRHSFATTMLSEDVNIHKIAKIMGHSIQQTQRYEHLVVKDLQKAILKHPLVRKSDPKLILEVVEGFLDSLSLPSESYTKEKGENFLRFELRV